MRGSRPPEPSDRWHTADVLGGLDLNASHNLFEANVTLVDGGQFAHHVAVERLLSRLDGHPLCLKLIAHQVTRDHDAIETLRRYDDKGVVILNQFGGRTNSKEQSLVVSLELSYSSKRISDRGRLLFRLISHLPCGLKREAVGHMLPASNVDDDAQDLIDAALVTISAEAGSIRLNMLPPVRDFAKTKQDMPYEIGTFLGPFYETFIVWATSVAGETCERHPA